MRRRRGWSGDRQRRRRYGAPAGRVLTTAALVASLSTASACVPASPSPATYEDKAATTLGSAVSEVSTVQLTLRQLDRGATFRPTTLTVLRSSEDSLDTATTAFTELNPPPVDDRLHARTTRVLGDAQDLLARARIAVVRDRPQEYPSLLDDLDRLHRRLDTFEKQVGS